MANKYTQAVNSSQTRFTNAPQGIIEHSKMHAPYTVDTDFSAGDIVPIDCFEVLPNSTFGINAHEVIRQATVLTPTMDNMNIDLYAFFVPNRIVNEAWKQVMGENKSGQWTAPQVSLVPIYMGTDPVQVPVCSVADYYGYPTQAALPAEVLNQCHDLKIRGYLSIFNAFFRSESFTPPVPYTTLNCYNGFFGDYGDSISINGKADGRVGSATHAVYGDGDYTVPLNNTVPPAPVVYGNKRFNALGRPLKACKLHDYFTSVLPSPQKGEAVTFSSITPMPIITSADKYETTGVPVSFDLEVGSKALLGATDNEEMAYFSVDNQTETGAYPNFNNLYADPAGNAVTLDDLRTAAAIQQVYEVLGRGGSRYIEYINSFFGLDIENPFDDIPTLLGHIRRELDLYQTAQTSASTEQSAQGNLSAFGYTSKGGELFKPYTFKEHGYVHILACVRHRNVYSSYLGRDNFRLNMLDFYQYPLANISEQPVYTREINPFASDPSAVFGYNEAWAEYRMSINKVSGHMRSGVQDSLSFWNYSDNFDEDLLIADGEWLKSNSAEVLARSTAIQDTFQPQFKAKFFFDVVKELPMPTYSVAGLDVI